MTTPAITITEVDGALGISPSGGPKPLAVIGATDSGTADTAAPYGSTTALIAGAGGGPAVEAAAFHIETKNRPVVLVPTAKGVAGSFPGGTTVTSTGTGTSVVTMAATPLPTDDFEMVVKVATGGTVGTAGIELQISYDGGRNYGGKIALGTATSYVIPNAGEMEFAAGTMVAGDTHSYWTKAPQWTSAELTLAFAGLKAYGGDYGIIEIVGDVDATALSAIATALNSLDAVGQHHTVVCHLRMPESGETDATYATAMDAIVSGFADTRICVYGGACEITTSPDLGGWRYRRPPSFECASVEANSTEEVNIADPNLGPLTASILDTNGNPKYHDERLDASLDSLRIACLRTFVGLPGVYVNRPILISASGSDFELVPHRRVMDLAKQIASVYLTRRLNSAILVNKSTGYILEQDAIEIEAGLNAQLRGALEAKPKASGGGYANGGYVQVSRTDNLLSTKTMTVRIRIVPLAYPEAITVEIGFYNPALAVVPTSV
jgi:hypothetical protein